MAMIGAPIFKDVFKYKAKFIGKFTGKQLALDAIGIVLIILLVFLFGFPDKKNYDLPTYALLLFVDVMVKSIVAIPFFLFAHFEPYGMSLWGFLKKAVFPYLQSSASRKGENLRMDKVMIQRRNHPMKVKRSKTYKAIM